MGVYWGEALTQRACAERHGKSSLGRLFAAPPAGSAEHKRIARESEQREAVEALSRELEHKTNRRYMAVGLESLLVPPTHVPLREANFHPASFVADTEDSMDVVGDSMDVKVSDSSHLQHKS